MQRWVILQKTSAYVHETVVCRRIRVGLAIGWRLRILKLDGLLPLTDLTGDGRVTKTWQAERTRRDDTNVGWDVMDGHQRRLGRDGWTPI